MLPEDRRHRLRRLLTVGIEDVPVDVGRHADRGVPEDLADYLELDATGQHQRRRRVAQLVRMPVRQPRVFAHLLKVAVQVAWIDRRTDGTSEDESRLHPRRPQIHSFLLLLVEVTRQKFHHWLGQVDRAPALQGLGVGRHDVPALAFERTPDAYHSPLEVHVLPLQSQRLASAHSRREHQGVERLVTVAVKKRQEVPRLLRRERTPLGSSQLGRPREPRHVPRRHTPADPLVEALREHGADPVHRRR